MALTILVTLLGLGPGRVLATTGPYTFPFFDPGVNTSQGYGCTTYSNEPTWSGTNADGIQYGCSGSSKWFHKGIDYGNFDTGAKRDIAAADAGQVVKVHNGSSGSTCGSPSTGNHVVIKHDSTHYTLYYHLREDSITVQQGQTVSAGQKIGKAGNTGNSCGVHLHYELMTCNCENSDPEETYKPNGKWTTSPGRVPWRAQYVSRSFSGTIYINQWETRTLTVTWENIGGRTWKQTNPADGKQRQVYAGSTVAAGDSSSSSPFQASDWISSWQITTAGQSSVAPDANGTFTFGLKSPYSSGTHTQYLNLRADGLRWFLMTNASGSEIDSLAIPIGGLPPLCSCVEP
jgi:murein DD-endopeptidase MepM/ murein hydrolase activator NlpD